MCENQNMTSDTIKWANMNDGLGIKKEKKKKKVFKKLSSFCSLWEKKRSEMAHDTHDDVDTCWGNKTNI